MQSLAASGAVNLTFGSMTPTIGTASPSTVINNLLTSFPDFDCTLQFTQGSTTRSVSAKSMLTAGAYEFLSTGSVCTELRIADHAGRSYDFGFDAYKPLRPAFYVNFGDLPPSRFRRIFLPFPGL